MEKNQQLVVGAEERAWRESPSKVIVGVDGECEWEIGRGSRSAIVKHGGLRPLSVVVEIIRRAREPLS
jgi:hypothetical protein